MAAKTTIIEKISEDEGIAWLTFNRPERKNAYSRGLMAEFIDSLKAIRQNVAHRMRYYANPLNDVEGYLHSQKAAAARAMSGPM